jgi:hypothetical protein
VENGEPNGWILDADMSSFVAKKLDNMAQEESAATLPARSTAMLRASAPFISDGSER